MLCSQDVSSDSNIRVTATKLVRQDELVIVLILNNQKHPAISSVTMTIEPPSNLKASPHTHTCDYQVTVM